LLRWEALMPTIPLPDGHSAELRDPNDVRRSDVRAAMRSADASGVDLSGGLTLDAMGALEDGLLPRFIVSWTLTNAIAGSANGDGTAPLPITAEALQDLPLSYYRPLEEAFAPALAATIRQVTGGGQEPVDPTSAAPSSKSVPTVSTPNVRAD
jgi:hypothetical protein